MNEMAPDMRYNMAELFLARAVSFSQCNILNIILYKKCCPALPLHAYIYQKYMQTLS